jgi:putative ABC transport system permease protein
LGIKLVEGRNFSYDRATDTAGESVIVNRNFRQKARFERPAWGAHQQRRWVYGHRHSRGFQLRIAARRYCTHGASLRIQSFDDDHKIRGGDVQHTIADVSALWKKFSPDQPIRYTFLDQEFATMYADVQRTGKIFNSFAVLAITIACLGLFALSAFMAEQRSKEIGVRKVLGASVQGITTLLSTDFIKLVLLAILIASPIAWWAMDKWLQDFAYKITISWWMFAAAGLGAILIALITVSFQSVKAALANPVRSLRTD